MAEELTELLTRITKLETQLCADRKLFEERLKAITDARDLQAEEYRRRLEDLNGEYDRINEILDSCVSAKVYDVEHKYLSTKVNDLELTRAKMEGKASVEDLNKIGGRSDRALVLSALGLLIGIVGMVLGFFGQ